ncbi:hypothetical protein PBCVNY2B_767L [Paramecium bursaria Chlorella virus NY2B]|uniref:Uncharacterized protein B747L n=1 Tax=Paramecium bursaria Chlorella virus NY2A TaxID=46021 RepID=A7IXS2_PBCVN|nr:hypothetical protein NY2A_B747L [Paramecium bursaria Chlorella virus NY2A]ABT15146.1 hypothetical protein NY2A_B747L [Paramecium bursaria Chlorella virus NY2A]AGE54379.1 hypothetical protein PBCVIL52s1_786L [Paramecium bursaria Chlorella virus IL-5-2s1]AGE58497.1 hypothetical protein PBCVNY2B_767L [Paramecium bursaria Chlorella virus NY2B]
MVKSKQKTREYQEEYRTKNKEKLQQNKKDYYQQNKELLKKKRNDRYHQNKDVILQQQNEYCQQNKEMIKKNQRKRNDILYTNAINSLLQGYIIDMTLWTRWFSKKNYKQQNIIYEMSPKYAFELMSKNCFYCGDICLGIDRLDSGKGHTVENCVGCCESCNSSKGALDPKTFILQAVYRRTYIYFEDTYIWYSHKNVPRYDKYKKNAERQNRPFELTRVQFNNILRSECHYCHRTPDKTFGIDKLFPDDGYVLDNCVTACASCNRAKWDKHPEEFTLREERITERYLHGHFENLPYVPKNVSFNTLFSN